MQYLYTISKRQNDFCSFPKQAIQYHSNPTLGPVLVCFSSAEEAEVEWFYEDLQYLLELTPPKDVLQKLEVKRYLGQQVSLALEYSMKQGKG